MTKLEIACNSYGSCLNAIEGGADRLELFENLDDGGCTPSFGMTEKAIALSVPVYVMIRPRGGNFTYNNDEIDIMLRDIEMCRKLGVKGIVFGCLTKSGQIDIELNKRLLQAWHNGPATFHRAIDRSSDIIKSCAEICDLGFERILSSGGAANAPDGIMVLKNMQSQFRNSIVIMPGSGVTAANAKEIIRVTECHEIHATCKITLSSEMTYPDSKLKDSVRQSDAALVRELKKSISQEPDLC